MSTAERLRETALNVQATDTTRYITASELSTWDGCRRVWFLKNHLGYRPRFDAGDVRPHTIGTLLHAGLEAYYSGRWTREEDSPTSAALDVIRASTDANLAELEAEGRASAMRRVESAGELVRIMLEGYFEWLEETGADADLDVQAAEERIEVPLPGFTGVVLLGKVDYRAIERSTGRELIIDTKSCQTAKDQEIAAPMSRQFKHYVLIRLLKARAEGRTEDLVAGARVRWVRRVKRGVRANPPFYGEVMVDYPLNVIRAYYRQLRGRVAEILNVEERLRAGEDAASVEQEFCGPSPSRVCGYCDFRPVCPVLDDETADVASVLEYSYAQADPLARYTETANETEESE